MNQLALRSQGLITLLVRNTARARRRRTLTCARFPLADAIGAALLGLCTVLASSIAGAATITLSPGANIQSAVDSNPGGTAFILGPGVYRMQAVVPKAGDSFTGQAGADLNGSKLLTNWEQSGVYWTSTGAPALNERWGWPSTTCNDLTTGCAYPQDLYLNNTPLVHKLRLPITTGQWYFDYTNDVVYIADNPTGQKVELGVARQAFGGYANNVTVQNLIVEKYASTLNAGAVSPRGSRWIIKSNEVRLNHSAGIKPMARSDNYEQILSNNVHDNGQQGIGVGGGTGTLVQYNTIANNNYANTFWGNEEGGGKIATTVNAQVLNNTYTNNNGVGLWGDGGDTGTIFSGNTVTGSRLDGIRYEISHYGTISNNILVNNAQYRGTGACSSGGNKEIALARSDHTTVSNNTITSNCAGIMMTSSSQNQAIDDSVLDNIITYNGSGVIANRIGGQDTNNPPTLYDPASGNYFDYNTYHFSSLALLTLKNWTWNGAPVNPMNWLGWRAAGEDIHGIAD
jgi:parallel beta-helix repeat protein